MFVGRHDEITRTIELLEELPRPSFTLRIYNLHAITGMGKTWLSYTLYRHIAANDDIACAWMSFEPNVPMPGGETAGELTDARDGCRECWRVLHLAEAIDELELPARLERYQVRIMRHTTARQPRMFVLFLDALNRLDTSSDTAAEGSLWEDLQLRFIRPLTALGNVLIFCSSQVPLLWTWDLHMQCQLWPLDPLSREETRELLRQYHLEDSTDIIYEMTFGHPASITLIVTSHLMTSLADVGLDSARPPETPPISDKRVTDIHTAIEQLDDVAGALIRVIGMLRRVDVPTVQHVLQHVPSGLTLPVRNQAVHQALAQYVERGLVVTVPDFAPFSFARDVRAVVEADLQHQQPHTYQQLCHVLSAWYLGELTRKPFTNRLYFTEWVYFSLQHLLLTLAATPQAAARAAHSQAWMQQFRECWQQVGGDDMRGRLQRDDQVRQLLIAVGLAPSIGAVAGYDIRDNAQRFRRELVDYLFEHRFPRHLTQPEREVLTLIARSFDEDGFDLAALQAAVAANSAEDVPTIPRLHFFVRLFSEIYAVHYDQKRGRFVMDPWLRQFLRGAATTRLAQRAYEH